MSSFLSPCFGEELDLTFDALQQALSARLTECEHLEATSTPGELGAGGREPGDGNRVHSETAEDEEDSEESEEEEADGDAAEDLVDIGDPADAVDEVDAEDNLLVLDSGGVLPVEFTLSQSGDGQLEEVDVAMFAADGRSLQHGSDSQPDPSGVHSDASQCRTADGGAALADGPQLACPIFSPASPADNAARNRSRSRSRERLARGAGLAGEPCEAHPAFGGGGNGIPGEHSDRDADDRSGSESVDSELMEELLLDEERNAQRLGRSQPELALPVGIDEEAGLPPLPPLPPEQRLLRKILRAKCSGLLGVSYATLVREVAKHAQAEQASRIPRGPVSFTLKASGPAGRPAALPPMLLRPPKARPARPESAPAARAALPAALPAAGASSSGASSLVVLDEDSGDELRQRPRALPAAPDAYSCHWAPVQLLRAYGTHGQWVGRAGDWIIFDDDGVRYRADTVLPLREDRSPKAKPLRLGSLWLLLSLRDRYKVATSSGCKELGASIIQESSQETLLDFLLGRRPDCGALVAADVVGTLPPPRPERLGSQRRQTCQSARSPLASAVLQQIPAPTMPTDEIEATASRGSESEGQQGVEDNMEPDPALAEAADDMVWDEEEQDAEMEVVGDVEAEVRALVEMEELEDTNQLEVRSEAATEATDIPAAEADGELTEPSADEADVADSLGLEAKALCDSCAQLEYVQLELWRLKTEEEGLLRLREELEEKLGAVSEELDKATLDRDRKVKGFRDALRQEQGLTRGSLGRLALPLFEPAEP